MLVRFLAFESAREGVVGALGEGSLGVGGQRLDGHQLLAVGECFWFESGDMHLFVALLLPPERPFGQLTPFVGHEVGTAGKGQLLQVESFVGRGPRFVRAVAGFLALRRLGTVLLQGRHDHQDYHFFLRFSNITNSMFVLYRDKNDKKCTTYLH